MVTYQRIKPSSKESYLGAGLRNIVSTGANIADTLGNIATLPLRAGEALATGAEQARNKALEHALQPGNEANLYGSDPTETRKALENYKKNPQQEAVIAPMIKQAKEAVKSKFPEKYLEPHNETERVFQDYASLVGTHLLLPGSTLKDIPGLVGRTVVGRAAGEGVKKAGGGEIGRIAAEIAVPGLLKGLNPKNIQEYFTPKKDAAYKALESVKGEADASKYEKLIEDLYKKEHGFAKSVTNRKALTALGNEIHNGKIPLNKLPETQERINRLIYGRGENKPSYLGAIQKEFKSMLRNSSKEHPEFGKMFKEANDLSLTTQRARTAANFIRELKNEPGLVGKAAFGLFSNPIVKGTQAQYNLITKFPKEALKYYGKAITAASEGRITAFKKEFDMLDKLMTKANPQTSESKNEITYQRVK